MGLAPTIFFWKGERAVEAWPDYATYQTNTDRRIPMFVLESIGAISAPD